jgi:hypothetical protein
MGMRRSVRGQLRGVHAEKRDDARLLYRFTIFTAVKSVKL